MALEISDLKGSVELASAVVAASSSSRIFDITSLDTNPPPYTSTDPQSQTLAERPASSHLVAFEPDDYVEGDAIPKHLLLGLDTWLPDPPEPPTKLRPTNLFDQPNSNALITYPENDGSLGKIENLHLDIIEKKSALIAASFEKAGGQYRLHLDALTSISARPFVQYLYVDSYAEVEAEYEDVPSSLLLHCQMHFLGALFDMSELQSQAFVNVIRQCEFACFSPEQPIDLCAAIRYCYDHVDYCRRPIEHIMAYCIERFSAHKLGDDAAFRQLAYAHRPFHFDIVRILVERNYSDEAALDIIRLPFAPPPIHDDRFIRQTITRRRVDSCKRPYTEETPALQIPQDIVTETIANQDLWTARVAQLHTQSLITLALREKQQIQSEDDATRPHKRVRSEDEGFVLVDRTVPDTVVDSYTSEEEAFVVVPEQPGKVTPTAEGQSSNTGSEGEQGVLQMAGQRLRLTITEDTSRRDDTSSSSSSPRSDSSWVLT